MEPRNTVALSSDIRSIPAMAGIGLRMPHHQDLLESSRRVGWLEVHPENFMFASAARSELDLIAEQYPLSLHAVGLSIGSLDGPTAEYLSRFRQTINRYRPSLISDHLSWSSVDGIFVPDLLPLPYTEEMLEITANHIRRVQDYLGRRLLIENPSTYGQHLSSTLSEEAFLAELVARADCGILLDVNNLLVSALNHGRDPRATLMSTLSALPHASIGEIHLAGHATITSPSGALIRVDDHGSSVSDTVWDLFETVIRHIGPRPTLVEWDTRLPSFDVLCNEARKADEILVPACVSYA